MADNDVVESDGAVTPNQVATVLPVITTMRAQSNHAFSLDDLAEMAYLSRFHFNRVFATVAGIPPIEFMTALRFDRAKELLISTDLSVTEVCFEVGFSSLGTFSTRFTQLVGLSPAEYRRVPELIDQGIRIVHPRLTEKPGTFSNAAVHGEIRGLDETSGCIYIGLFPTRFARGRPITGQLLEGTNEFFFPNLPNGTFTLLAAIMPAGEGLFEHLRIDRRVRVGSGEQPIVINTGNEQVSCDVVIRPSRLIDPPILACLPGLVVT